MSAWFRAGLVAALFLVLATPSLAAKKTYQDDALDDAAITLIADLLLLVARAWRGESTLFLAPDTAREMLTRQPAGPYGLGAAIAESEGALIVMKRGQNVGYQSYLILLPGQGQGMVVMTNSDNGSILAEALIRRAAEIFGWPALPALAD